MANDSVDIIEDTLRRHKNLLNILLTDQTKKSNKEKGGKKNKKKNYNIIWATNSYPGHKSTDQIQIDDITGPNTHLIQPRIAKSKEEQKSRTRDKAEVFTPKEIVQEMNQQIDWTSENWPATEGNWQNYVSELKLEITCGEAPFIVGRYNAVNGRKVLKLEERIGFLDRKLQIVNKFTKTKDDWLKWTIKAFQASYGYEWQGDNLLLARENLLYTFIDFWNEKFPSDKINLERQVSDKKMKILTQIAEIISWNIFQMDGLKYVIPMTCKYDPEYNEIPPMLTLLEWKETKNESKDKSEKPKTKENCRGCRYNNPYDHNGTKVKVKDWNTGESYYFTKILKGH